MNIASTQYTLKDKAFEIYLSGCYGNCKGCHNYPLKDFSIGEQFGFNHILKWMDKIQKFSTLIENIWILGGEPLDQDIESLEFMIRSLKILMPKLNIWLFTRYSLIKVPEEIKKLCDYIKCGAYIEELKTDDNTQYGIKLATNNQTIYKKGEDY